MKKKYINMIPCFILLCIFTIVGINSLKQYYEEIVNTTGLVYDNFEKELKKENEKAMKDNQDFQKLLKASEITDQPEGGLMEQGTVTSEEKSDTPVIQKLKLHSLSALLLDSENDRVLYEDNGKKRMPMASTTKIMTCIVALENADLNGTVTVSSYAASMPDVQLKMRKGDQFYLKDLLFSLMLESHNDTAVAIAEYIGGTVEGFATMMNDKAKELRCYDTNFVTPNGLDAEGHYTTARDLAIIASYAIKNEQFIAITNTSAHSFNEIKKGKAYAVSNKNRFLYMMEGAIGVKTGFTNDAGYCFVGAIKEDGKTLISVVLGCGWPPNKSLKWSDTKELMSYGVENYEEKQIFQEVDFDPVLVKDGQQRYETLKVDGDLSLLMRKDELIKIHYDIPASLNAPIKANSIVGKANYYVGDLLYAELPIYATTDILKIDFSYCVDKILKLWSQQY